MAVAFGEGGVLDAAIPSLLHCLELARELGQSPSSRRPPCSFRVVVHGEFLAAHDYLTRSLAICRDLDDPLPEAIALTELAKLYLRHADPRSAALAAEAEVLSREHPPGQRHRRGTWGGGCLDLVEGRAVSAVARWRSRRLWRTRKACTFRGALRSLGDACILEERVAGTRPGGRGRRPRLSSETTSPRPPSSAGRTMLLFGSGTSVRNGPVMRRRYRDPPRPARLTVAPEHSAAVRCP